MPNSMAGILSITLWIIISARKEKVLIVEKNSSIYCKDRYTKKDIERNIFANPFKRFEDMRFMKKCKEIEYVEINKHVFKRLSMEEKERIGKHCNEKLEEYYRKKV